ncbi:MAG: rod shape-determining protein MreC [Ruminococcus sp.]|nr:rod shape-determining protein MreC [Ruminococcus sp.]
MRDFLSTKSAKILIATLAVIIVIAILGATGNPWVSSAFNFLTKGLSTVTATFTEGHKDYDELKAENEKLRQEAADLRTQLVDYDDIRAENARLWKYYKLKKTNPDFEILPASVIRRDTNEAFYSFTIDAGSSSGISVQDPVITENGVIGFINSVNATSSKVTTILSPDLQAGAVDKKTGESGVVSGSAILGEENKTAFSKIDANAKVKKGDVIVTSGIGGVYPADLILGEVTDIQYDDYDAAKYAVVKSYEDIKNVTNVVVLTDFKNKGEIKKGAD